MLVPAYTTPVPPPPSGERTSSSGSTASRQARVASPGPHSSSSSTAAAVEDELGPLRAPPVTRLVVPRRGFLGDGRAGRQRHPEGNHRLGLHGGASPILLPCN